VRTFYGSAFFEAIHAASFKRFMYQSLFYGFEVVSCLRHGTNIGISRITARALPMITGIMPCGVPLKRYTPDGPKSGQPSILFVGDLDSRKRGRLLLETFLGFVRPLYPGATLTVIGPQIENDVNGVRYAGQIAEEALVKEYQKAWIYCSVSSYEGFGVPLIEAMACGTAVAAIDTAGAREIVTHDHDGLLCKDKTLAKTIGRLISDAALRGRLIANGLVTVKKFDIDGIAGRYKEIYSHCLGTSIHEK
jgi:glycosyltransferase involved in cell wall biosynthesis